MDKAGKVWCTLLGDEPVCVDVDKCCKHDEPWCNSAKQCLSKEKCPCVDPLTEHCPLRNNDCIAPVNCCAEGFKKCPFKNNECVKDGQCC